jgi:hypothetical protein
MWAYALIANGFINWDYQRNTEGIFVKSLLVIAPGAILLASTFIPYLAAKLDSKNARYFWGTIGVIALIYAFVN